ncbi:hypothetical protein H0H93_013766 [Arthromyces matolae]|nr:hypothetical protein H0H93_013766 [Arthromyces matolae]
MHASHLSEDAMVKTIKKVTTFILPELEDDQVVSADVFYAIAAAKHIVSTFQSKKRGAIKNIEACEAAALAKRLPRYSDFLISDTDILELMKKFEAQPKATNRRSRMFQKLALKDLVQKLAYLPLENQRGISKELEAGYKAAVAKIDKWDSEADIWAKLAKEVLGEWEGLNSLVNVSNNAT